MQVPRAITDRELPSFNFWTARSSEEKATLRNICHLCWDHEPKSRVTMAFIVASLRDSGHQKYTLRPLNQPDSSGRDIKRYKVASSEALQAFDSFAVAQGVRKVQLEHNRPLIRLSLSLEHFFRLVDSQSEVHNASIKRIRSC